MVAIPATEEISSLFIILNNNFSDPKISPFCSHYQPPPPPAAKISRRRIQKDEVCEALELVQGIAKD
ncbi:hypothetical protein LWI29_037001 [Acer saccharum]|uniref:Uncharacterized protein n=1 Tax=Acer saccharum TaxID=4024 RepID=A0AA39T8B8_ACESA|nr:hypothetical protein LWI29_037001 [Acer saccharum]